MKNKKNWFKKSFKRFKREWREIEECLKKNDHAGGFLSLCYDLIFILGIACGVILGYLYCNYQLVPIA